MQAITTIGLDIAKSVFQVHGVDAAGQVVVRRQLKRRYVLAFFEKLSPCLVGIEACASSHHWSRELQALRHTVRLMPPACSQAAPKSAHRRGTSGDAERSLQQIAEFTSRLFGASTAADVNAAFGEANRRRSRRPQR
jgi:transposase